MGSGQLHIAAGQVNFMIQFQTIGKFGRARQNFHFSKDQKGHKNEFLENLQKPFFYFNEQLKKRKLNINKFKKIKLTFPLGAGLETFIFYS